jgi:SAM-dependent methyltransferase
MPGISGTTQRFWDRFSSEYDAFQQGDAPERIVNHLMDEGVLTPRSSVLEIGAGPGTYTHPLASRVHRVTATDISERMLDINREIACGMCLENITFVHDDWNNHVRIGDHDACIMAFVPGSDSQESISRMEGESDTCVIVSWNTNHGENITQSIRQSLGIDWPHPSHDRSLKLLESNGRSAERMVFDVDLEGTLPYEYVYTKELSRFESAGIDASEACKEVISDMCQDGVFRYRLRNRVNVTYWRTD